MPFDVPIEGWADFNKEIKKIKIVMMKRQDEDVYNQIIVFLILSKLMKIF